MMEKELDEIIQSQHKKRKVDIDLNKKPGEKRQNKYYWPKIDVPKVPTPRPKTPKVQTPKVRRKNYGKKVGDGRKILEHVVCGTKKDSNCEKSLNFEDSEKANLEDGEVKVLVKQTADVRMLETRKDRNCKKSLNFEDSEKANLEDGEVEVSLKQSADVPSDDKEVKKLDKIEGREGLKVYRRTRAKCLNKCRKLGPNFLKCCKKKRAHRNRKSNEDLKPFKEFNYSSIIWKLLYRIAKTKGDTRMLFPTKMNSIPELYGCVFRILSSRMTLRKKKRSAKRLTSTNNNVVNEVVISENTMPSCPTSALEFLGDCNTGGIMSDPNQEPFAKHERLEPLEHVNGSVQTFERLASPCCCTTNSSLAKESMAKEGKAMTELERLEHVNGSGQTYDRLASACSCTPNSCLAKESKAKEGKGKKSRRPYKRKAKRKDYLSEIVDWRDISLEQVLDPFIQDFNSLVLYDDPKKLERWSIMVSDRSNNGNGAPESNEEDTQFIEERKLLFKRIARFILEMIDFQGRKEFVKWNGSVLDSVVGVYLTQNVSDVLSSNAYMLLASRFPLKPVNQDKDNSGDSEIINSQESLDSTASTANPIVEHPPDEDEETSSTRKEYDAALRDMLSSLPNLQGNKGKEKKGEAAEKFDWEPIRVQFVGQNTERKLEAQDSVDWEAVRKAPVKHIADAIESRGQHRIIAAKIQKALNRLVNDHGTLDLEWLRNAPPEVAKPYLLSFYGLGLKSVECLRLLTLHHHGFPVDVNIARIAIRLGWVPLKPLPVGLPFHLLQKYPLENDIQQYLWPRLQHLNQELLYQLHYQMITFGKVFCLKKNPNCRACPFKDECKYYKSLVDSANSKHPRLAWTQDRRMINLKGSSRKKGANPFDLKKESLRASLLPAPMGDYPFGIKKDSSRTSLLPALMGDSSLDAMLSFQVSDCTSNSQLWSAIHTSQKCEDGPIIEYPASPKKVEEPDIPDIEDLLKYEPDEEFIVVNLKSQEFKQAFPNPYEENYGPPRSDKSSKALARLSPEDANIPLPKQINPARLRTEHQVYELPCGHPLLKDLDRQQGPIPYLLAIWTQGGEKNGDMSEGCSDHVEKACSSENVPNDSSTVLGTILIPVRTAMRGSFPLNGTYFQLNEVFADDETSEHPINVPTDWIWWLPKRTLYCGSGTASVFRGLKEEEIRHCCCQGYICTRGFNRRTRAPKALPLKFHYRPYVKGKVQQDEEED